MYDEMMKRMQKEQEAVDAAAAAVGIVCPLQISCRKLKMQSKQSWSSILKIGERLLLQSRLLFGRLSLMRR